MHIGDVHVAGAPVRSRYLEQVARIAPETLVDREAELAELATFCTAPESRGRYMWWQAEAWSGKSALMSWFVLHPPAGVAIVSFFVTGRWAGQNDRTAFVDNVLEQLASMLGEPLPVFLTESTKETRLLASLTDAARLCESRSEELVLLVDGVDEDRGVTTEADAHSILALLPTRGVRVVLAGRPNPPVPPDVPDDHPVWDPAIRRTLTPSPAARTIRTETERELKALLRGTAVEQDLLALVTASGGGLTATDLAELSGLSAWEVEDHLRTRTGRSFTRLPSRLNPGTAPDGYALGHEELTVIARKALGDRGLRASRDRIHAWADGYAAESWPTTTPEYLVRGYLALLAETGDLPRMVRHATDPARQDRMLAMSGGNAAALADLRTALDATPAADLTTMTRVAVHRDHLIDRNAGVSEFLPLAWAVLGRGAQALQLAMSIDDPYRRLAALLHLAPYDALSHQLRTEALAEAVAAYRALPSIRRDGQLHDLVRELIHTGDFDLAEELVISADHDLEAAEVVVAALVAADQPDRATALIGSATAPLVRDRLAATAAAALAEAGDADHAEALARTIDDAGTRCMAWAWIGHELAASRPDRTARALAEADTIVVGLTPEEIPWALVHAHIAAGDLERAEQVARTMDDPGTRGFALTLVLAESDDPGRMLDDLLPWALGLPKDGYARRSVLDDLVLALTIIGETDRAEGVVLALAGKDRVAVTNAWISALLDQDLLDRATSALDTIPAEERETHVVDRTATALARAGRAAEAVALFDTAVGKAKDVSVRWSMLARVLYGTGEHDLAETAMRRAESLIAEEENRVFRSDMVAMAAITRVAVADTATAVATIERAIADTRSTMGHTSDDQYRTELAKAAALTGRRHLADVLSLGLPVKARDNWHRFVVDEFLAAGDIDHAIMHALAITGGAARAAALVPVTRALAVAGDVDRADLLARGITDIGQQRTAFIGIATAIGSSESAALDRLAELRPARGDDAALASEASDLARAGLFAAAELRIATMTDDFQRSRAVVAMVAGLIGAGQLDRAASWVATVAAPPARCAVLCTLAESLLRIGQDDRAAAPLAEATELARANVKQVRWRSEVVMVVTVLAVAGRADEAIELATDLDDLPLSAQALATVGELADDHTKAFDLALTRMDAIDDEYHREVAAREIAIALTAVADWSRAEDLGRSVVRGFFLYPVALVVVQAMVNAGEHGRALAYALSFSEALTCSHLLRPLTRCANPDQARRAIALSLALDRWPLTIVAAAAVELGCVTAAIEELTRLRPAAWESAST